VKAVNTPEMKEAFSRQGMDPLTSTPEQFGTFIHNEIAKNAKLAKAIGMKAQ
jgi:tripartite-type tricarboxylate transporter receptor subunit TctC